MKISAATTETTNLLYDQRALDEARSLAILIPGAFTRLGVFEAAEDWRSAGYGLAHYRFPGLDGRPMHPPLSIANAASEIRHLIARYPDKPIRLLGFSTGGAIALTAAAGVTGDVKVAAMSPAIPFGGGPRTWSRAVFDLARASLAVRSLRLEPVWLRYYRVLLFGRRVYGDTELADRADRIIAGRRARIVFPAGGMPRAHARDLRRWQLPEGTCFAEGKLRFFWGMEDPVFSRAQTLAFAEKTGAAVTGYADHGHLLFASHPPVFEDIFDFFEGRRATGVGVDLM